MTNTSEGFMALTKAINAVADKQRERGAEFARQVNKSVREMQESRRSQ